MTVVSSPLRRTGVFLLLGWTLAATVARAVRWPNDFAEAHWLLDYRFGFVRRGLVGECLSIVTGLTGRPPTEALIDGLSMAAFAGFCALLVALTLRLVRSGGWSSSAVLVAVAFLSSPFVVMSAHLVGYFDNLLVMLTVAAVVLLFRGRPWLASAVQALAVLVHESAIVYGFPVLCVAWIVTRPPRTAGDEAATPAAWLRAAAPLALPLAAFVFVALSPPWLLAPDFQDAYSRRLAGFPFVGGDMHLLVPEWLAPAGLGALTAQWHRFGGRVAFAEAYGLVLPTSLALFGYTVDRHELRGVPPVVLAMVAAIFAPVVMHLAAWDTVRIWTYSIGAAFLVAWVHARAGSPPAPASWAVRWVAVAAVTANVLAMTPLLDNLADRYALSTRLLLYAPVLIACAVLLGIPDGEPDA